MYDQKVQPAKPGRLPDLSKEDNMKNFLVHVTDLRSAYIKVKAKDIVSARKKGLKLTLAPYLGKRQ